MPLERFINLFVKILIFSAKSLTIFYLAKVLDEESFGKIGLIAAITIYYIYIVGMELHNFSNREFIGASEERKIVILSSLFVYYLVSAVAGYFVIYNVLNSMGVSIFPNELIVISLIILTEHLALEVYRLLIASQKQLIASMTYLVRASWIFLIIYLDIEGDKVTFIQVLSVWLAFNVLGLIIGIVYIVKNINHNFVLKIPDFKWLTKSLINSIPFLVAALSLGGLSALDRILISYDYSIKTLAGYVFYISIFNAIYSLVEASVYVYAYPKLILQKDNNVEFNDIYKRMWIESLCLFLILVGAGYLGLPVLLMFIDKLPYVEYGEIYFTLIFVYFLKVINANMQYYLYALNKDKFIYITNILMTPFFLTFYFATKEYFNFEAIIYSLIIAYLLNCVFRAYFIYNNNFIKN